MKREYRGMFRIPRRETNIEAPRVWCRGYCGPCYAVGRKVLVEFIPGYRWVVAGTEDPCDHQPKENST